MTANGAISIRRVSKQYRKGASVAYRTLRDSLARPLSRRRSEQEWFWALKDVDLDVPPGEVIGLIGRNGAGKTTLLKILSRITRPSEGEVLIHGRVGSLLEVGTGFHNELTGRENIFLNGAILGMPRREVARKLDQIVEFAEVGPFIETPVKRYSSGMQMRLAFAVAAHLEPEVMLVDEVLAVGDLRFQKKCLGKMGEVASGGRTIVFVSHQMNQIRRLCDRVAWLDGGRVVEVGPVAEVVARYEQAALSDEDRSESRERGPASFTSWSLEPDERRHSLDHWGEVSPSFALALQRPIKAAHIGVALYDAAGTLLWGANVDDVRLAAGRHVLRFKIPGLPLRPGAYRWVVSLWEGGDMLDLWDAVPEMLVVTDPVAHRSDEWAGILNLPFEFEVDESS
jgi:lipopolysaccharide transport system ATP-binding protein